MSSKQCGLAAAELLAVLFSANEWDVFDFAITTSWMAAHSTAPSAYAGDAFVIDQFVAKQQASGSVGMRIGSVLRGITEATLMNYVKVYNHQISQRALQHVLPVQALKKMACQPPAFFQKKPHDRQ